MFLPRNGSPKLGSLVNGDDAIAALEYAIAEELASTEKQ